MDQGQETTTPQSDDLRATLVAALEAPTGEPQTTESGSAEPQTTDTPHNGRPRDALGRFTGKTEASTETPTDDTTLSRTEEALEDKPEQEVEEPPVKPSHALRAPQSWGASAKAKFAELPPEIQQEVHKRERDISIGLQKNAELANFGRSLAEVISPYQAMLAAEGASPITVVNDMMRTAYLLRTAPPQQKAQLFRQVAQQFGVDLNSLTAEEPYVDPQIAALQTRQQQLEQYLQQQQYYAQQQSQQAQAQETDRLTSEIDTFATDPANTHFEEVRADMAALLKAGRAQGLADAYEMAIWARPDIRSSLLQQQQAEAEAKRKAEAAKRAKEAAAAAVSVRGAPHGGSGLPVPKDSLRAELEAAWSR